jgi:lipid-A-disaccharide synthase-like uncharacterized protein
MNLIDLFGYAGLIFLSMCWVPQTIDTVKTGTVTIRKSFLVLYLLGSVLLLLQAVFISNVPLILLNSFTTVSSSINLFYGFFPRTSRS